MIFAEKSSVIRCNFINHFLSARGSCDMELVSQDHALVTMAYVRNDEVFAVQVVIQKDSWKSPLTDERCGLHCHVVSFLKPEV